MTAFDTAWSVLKAPYHGTTSDHLPSIMAEGLKPHGHKEGHYGDQSDSGRNYGDKDRVFSTKDRKEALAFAMLALVNDKRKRDWVPGGKMRYNENDPKPVVLHFPDEMAQRHMRPGSSFEPSGFMVSDETIDPEHLTVDFEGDVDLSDEPEYGAYFNRLLEQFRGGDE